MNKVIFTFTKEDSEGTLKEKDNRDQQCQPRWVRLVMELEWRLYQARPVVWLELHLCRAPRGVAMDLHGCRALCPCRGLLPFLRNRWMKEMSLWKDLNFWRWHKKAVKADHRHEWKAHWIPILRFSTPSMVRSTTNADIVGSWDVQSEYWDARTVSGVRTWSWEEKGFHWIEKHTMCWAPHVERPSSTSYDHVQSVDIKCGQQVPRGECCWKKRQSHTKRVPLEMFSQFWVHQALYSRLELELMIRCQIPFWLKAHGKRKARWPWHVCACVVSCPFPRSFPHREMEVGELLWTIWPDIVCPKNPQGPGPMEGWMNLYDAGDVWGSSKYPFFDGSGFVG